MTKAFCPKSIVVLSGGVGGAKFVQGLTDHLGTDELSVVVNTGDDFEHWGLWIAPDLDTNMYTLAGLSNDEQGWGLRHESFQALEMMNSYGEKPWFRLGDRDLATHLMRTKRLMDGVRFTQITGDLCNALGVRHRLLPMSDDPFPTRIEVVGDDGGKEVLPFQEWLVKRHAPPVTRVLHQANGKATPEVLEALRECAVVLIGPSNPYVSIFPILQLAKVRGILEKKVVVAVSPIVGGKAVKGPLAEMIPALSGAQASAASIVKIYDGILNAIAVENGDAAGIDIATLETKTVMQDPAHRSRFAKEVLDFASQLEPVEL